jgi:ZIP family zinc transporter
MLESLSVFWYAVACSGVAWAGTAAGGLAACVLSDAGSARLAARANAAAAGVMMMLCVLELMPSALSALSQARAGFCFVGGMLCFLAAQQRLSSSSSSSSSFFFSSSSSSPRVSPELLLPSARQQQLLTSNTLIFWFGLAEQCWAGAALLMLTMMVHNTPEGLAVLLAASQRGARTLASLGVHTTLGIAFHNCFEGVAVAVSVFAATRSRARALGAAALSGLSEPAAVLVGYALLGENVSAQMVSVMMAWVRRKRQGVEIEQNAAGVGRHDCRVFV